MRRASALLVPLLVLCLVASGCGGPSSPAEDGAGRSKYASNATFTISVPDDLGVFDPYRKGLWAYAKIAYDSLVHQQPTGSFVSGLAGKWTVDATSATFTLRPRVTCSDGSELTASQVAADINWVANPDNQSPIYGTTVPAVPLTATADDTTRTVRVVMKRPFGFMLHTLGQLPIMCANGLKNPKLLENSSDGTGPFVLTKFVPGQSYTFTVRKGYTWGPAGARTSALGTPATLVLRVITNETTAANLLVSGEVNLARIDGADRQRLDAQDVDHIEVPAAGAWLWFNQLDGRPTADLRVRRALVQALDLDEVIKVNTAGSGSASTGLVAMEPKPCAGDTTVGLLPKQDVVAAESLLDQAGWTKGSGGIRTKNGRPLALDLHYATFAALNKPTAELLAQRWRGIGVRVKTIADTNTAWAKVLYETSNWDVIAQGFGFVLPSHSVPYFSGPIPPKGRNLAGVHNKAYDNLVAKAEALTPPRACTYWNNAERALFRNVDVVPVANQPWLYYLKNAEAKTAGFDLPIPTSIRILK